MLAAQAFSAFAMSSMQKLIVLKFLIKEREESVKAFNIHLAYENQLLLSSHQLFHLGSYG